MVYNVVVWKTLKKDGSYKIFTIFVTKSLKRNIEKQAREIRLPRNDTESSDPKIMDAKFDLKENYEIIGKIQSAIEVPYTVGITAGDNANIYFAYEAIKPNEIFEVGDNVTVKQGNKVFQATVVNVTSEYITIDNAPFDMEADGTVFVEKPSHDPESTLYLIMEDRGVCNFWINKEFKQGIIKKVEIREEPKDIYEASSKEITMHIAVGTDLT